MKSTYFTGKLEITGGFEDPVALWAFDPDSVSFERVSESRIDSRSFGYIGEDLYFIRTYFLSDDLRDNGSTLISSRQRFQASCCTRRSTCRIGSSSTGFNRMKARPRTRSKRPAPG